MSLAPDSKNLLLGRGAIYFDRFASGTTNKTGELHLGNCTALEISTTDELKEKYSSMDATSGLLKSVNTKRTVEVKLTGDEFSLENLALALMGDSGTLSQTSGTITGETITTSSKQGRWYPTAKRSISSVVVKVGVATKTAGTDYEVDGTTGRIKILSGGTITDGSTVTVDYSYAVVALNTIAGGKASTVEGYLRFIGDPTAGPKYEVEVWRVSVSPEGAVPFIQDDFGSWSLTLKALGDNANHPNEPYYRVIERA